MKIFLSIALALRPLLGAGLYDYLDYGFSKFEFELSFHGLLSDESIDHSEEESDEWHELSSSENEDDFLPILPPPKATISIIFAKEPPKKEHTIRQRMRVVTMVDDGVPITRITAITGISRSRVYALHAVARERGWIEKSDMVLEPSHVENAARSGRPIISAEARACVLAIVTKNSTTRGLSCLKLSKEIKKKGHHVSPRTVNKILKDEGYN